MESIARSVVNARTIEWAMNLEHCSCSSKRTIHTTNSFAHSVPQSDSNAQIGLINEFHLCTVWSIKAELKNSKVNIMKTILWRNVMDFSDTVKAFDKILFNLTQLYGF